MEKKKSLINLLILRILISPLVASSSSWVQKFFSSWVQAVLASNSSSEVLGLFFNHEFYCRLLAASFATDVYNNGTVPEEKLFTSCHRITI